MWRKQGRRELGGTHWELYSIEQGRRLVIPFPAYFGPFSITNICSVLLSL